MNQNSQLSYIRGCGSLEVPFTTIPDMLRAHAISAPECLIFKFVDWKTFESENMTYNELYTMATKFAKGLCAIGIGHTDIVALGGDNCKDWPIALVGIQMAGAVPVFFTFSDKDGGDIKNLLSKLGDRCKAIIFNPGSCNEYLPIIALIIQSGPKKGRISCSSSKSLQWGVLMSQGKNSQFLTTDDIIANGHVEHPLPEVDPEDTAGVFMTSGSTGEPKLIPHSHYSLLVCGYYFSIVYGSSRKTLFNDLPFGWMGGFPCWEFFAGDTRILIKHFRTIPSLGEYKDIITKIIQTEKCESSLFITPTLQEIISDKERSCHFGSVTAGGEPIPKALTSAASRICDRFCVLYGSSEIGMVTYQLVDRDGKYVDYETGLAFPGVEVKVVDPKGFIVKRGARGEAFIRSPIKFTGYFQDEEKTTKLLNKYGWFRTEDSAIMMQNGSLVVEGRVSDSLVRSGGPGFISVSFIEGRLKQHPSIKDAVVISFLDDDNFSCVCCAVITKEKATCSAQELEEYLLDPENVTVDLYKQITVPKKFVFLEEFPLTFNGKTNRNEIALNCKANFSK